MNHGKRKSLFSTKNTLIFVEIAQKQTSLLNFKYINFKIKQKRKLYFIRKLFVYNLFRKLAFTVGKYEKMLANHFEACYNKTKEATAHKVVSLPVCL